VHQSVAEGYVLLKRPVSTISNPVFEPCLPPYGSVLRHSVLSHAYDMIPFKGYDSMHSISLMYRISCHVLDLLDTWIAGGLGLGLPKAPQSPSESVSVGHVRMPITSSASSVCSSFLLHVNQPLSFPTPCTSWRPMRRCGLDHEDGIRFCYVLHRRFMPRSAFE
jgi:hypothetical protein